MVELYVLLTTYAEQIGTDVTEQLKGPVQATSQGINIDFSSYLKYKKKRDHLFTKGESVCQISVDSERLQ